VLGSAVDWEARARFVERGLERASIVRLLSCGAMYLSPVATSQSCLAGPHHLSSPWTLRVATWSVHAKCTGVYKLLCHLHQALHLVHDASERVRSSVYTKQEKAAYIANIPHSLKIEAMRDSHKQFRVRAYSLTHCRGSARSRHFILVAVGTDHCLNYQLGEHCTEISAQKAPRLFILLPGQACEGTSSWFRTIFRRHKWRSRPIFGVISTTFSVALRFEVVAHHRRFPTTKLEWWRPSC
jgi:hypothetical protein